MEHLRREYEQGSLDESRVDPDALKQFDAWFADAAGAIDANAATLATVDADGMPDARIVLLKDVADGAFRFFTNYQSTKGRQLAASPKATLLFFWAALERQVRVRGRVAKVAAAESDAYFASRPRGSQIGAWASAQSEVLTDRASLDDAVRRYSDEYPEGTTVPRPPHWGGYALTPLEIEFWQGRTSRLHDRLLYVRAENDGGGWQIRRLSP